MSVSELLERLRSVDEVALLELLEVTADDLVDAFLDRIADNVERIHRYLDE